eukprot:CAMPEP_0201530868 /NCGR_PEP_ID=MMETSP0161_2-20130828/45968_1 /ASSEMBLY_ACC=CAM_ASM_000251 /TAXON_ID=180227 /ORGANISM="Neoparamoeba aestuarina, Strain SoJaBio B1-5/56/2" /LENGTH=84 /DNA_ID=CAMNT_0047933449 /DNA_START=220 /DNA_END=470 /DNA_ORIENTATION=+
MDKKERERKGTEGMKNQKGFLVFKKKKGEGEEEREKKKKKEGGLSGKYKLGASLIDNRRDEDDEEELAALRKKRDKSIMDASKT